MKMGSPPLITVYNCISIPLILFSIRIIWGSKSTVPGNLGFHQGTKGFDPSPDDDASVVEKVTLTNQEALTIHKAL